MEAGNAALQLSPVDDKNGGTAAWGRFEQTKEDVICFINLPEGTRAKMLKVNITSGAVSASVINGGALMHGMLVAQCARLCVASSGVAYPVVGPLRP